jgi:hypothetical protein
VSARGAGGVLAYGLGGGTAAALVLAAVGSASPGAARGAEYAALAAGLLAVHLGMRRAVGLAPPALLGRALVLAALVSAAVGLGAYALYAWLRPALLAERYASYRHVLEAGALPTARAAQELARLETMRAAYLDPGYQALSTAGTLFFVAVLLGGYAGFRAHLARRLGGAGLSR